MSREATSNTPTWAIPPTPKNMTRIVIFDRIYDVPENVRIALSACNQGHNVATYGRLADADIPPERLYKDSRPEHLLAMADAMLIAKYSLSMGSLRGMNRAYLLMDFVEKGGHIAINVV